jgi:rhodanese-related sulfurtransferase
MNRIILHLITPLLFLSACAQNTQKKSFTDVNSVQFEKLVTTGKGILLDVRTENEFKNGHIANAGQLNFYASDFRSRLLLLPKDQPIYIYCLTGSRSRSAAQLLVQNGYTNVYNLQRGIMEWNQQSLPVVSDPKARPDMDNNMEPDQFAKLMQSDELIFIDFYAPWCSPCLKMMPMMDSLKVEYQNQVNIVKVNADASKSLIKDMKLIGVPYLALYYKGELLFSKNGAITREELTGILQANIQKYPGKKKKSEL